MILILIQIRKNVCRSTLTYLASWTLPDHVLDQVCCAPVKGVRGGVPVGKVGFLVENPESS